MPPWASAPTTSYCPATTSPGCSLTVNEYSAPQAGQKPSERVATFSAPWPTFAPQRGQTRASSGTSGLARTAFDGSIAGAGGTRVSPAPIRAVVSRSVLLCRVGRPPKEAARADPRAVEPRCTDVRVRDVAGADAGVAARSLTSGEPQTSQ